MRVLFIHADYIRFEAKKKAIKDAEELEKKKDEASEALVAFVACEKVDESSPQEVAKKLVEEIENVYKKVNAKTVVLYPYAHLSSELSSGEVAREILDTSANLLSAKGYEVKKAPFGWYKSFQLSCKGHPLSELSRVILPEKEKKEAAISKALKAEEKLKSYWYILDVDGKLIELEKFDFTNHEALKKFADYEISKLRTADKEPIHVKYMREHELVDYEDASDPGNMRWYPKGKLIKKLLEEHVSRILDEYGAMQVETPIMYTFQHKNLSRYLDRFPARQYILESGSKKYFLRFAACFGQYLMKKDMTISYKNLPLKLYEITYYSFRREQRGELSGLKRLRSFTMPDMHTLVRDMEEAKKVFLEQYKLSLKWMNSLGLSYEVGIRVVKDFYESNKDFIHELVKLVNKPVLLEMWDSRPFYFVMKFEFNFIDSLDKASALSTVQIDIENAERFEIYYTAEDGSKKHPLLLHASISGSIERNIYALLEQAYLTKKKENKKPTLPLWLSPTQVRIIPVSSKYLDYSIEIMNKLERENIRVDLDDRNETLSKRIRDAEKEWIPYIVVIGEKEIESGTLNVRIRENDSQVEMKLNQLIEDMKSKTKGFPFKPLPLPKFLSLRPKFVG